IPAADLKKVWEPFFTTGRGQGGSGLGLAIVRNLATTSLKGRVDIESKVGEGTAVIVEFPRALPDPAPGSAAAAPAVATATP
ncbi:MAG: HAMP domain-containing histidine kinase, partial [Alphaproteobacteria bacterium]|nr:HAMP domain-containing histidine kinase [Alphaproteobacteria bacterium]